MLKSVYNGICNSTFFEDAVSVRIAHPLCHLLCNVTIGYQQKDSLERLDSHEQRLTDCHTQIWAKIQSCTRYIANFDRDKWT